MSTEDDDIPQLPADTLALLAQFQQEQQKRAELEQSGEADVGEDWQLSQFWYAPETAQRLCREAVTAIGGKGRIACVSSPTLMKYFVEMEECQSGAIEVHLFEYDRRFGDRYPQQFSFYDYNTPAEVSEELHHSFDVLVVDPPHLARECLEKTAQTVKLLAKDNGAKIILCTGAIMEEEASKLLGLRRLAFEPRHANNLANDFACFANYQTSLLEEN